MKRNHLRVVEQTGGVKLSIVKPQKWRKRLNFSEVFSMDIVRTILGCFIGIAVYLLLSLVAPIKSLGDYAVGLMVALCFIFVAIVNRVWVVRP